MGLDLHLLRRSLQADESAPRRLRTQGEATEKRSRKLYERVRPSYRSPDPGDRDLNTETDPIEPQRWGVSVTRCGSDLVRELYAQASCVNAVL